MTNIIDVDWETGENIVAVYWSKRYPAGYHNWHESKVHAAVLYPEGNFAATCCGMTVDTRSDVDALRQAAMGYGINTPIYTFHADDDKVDCRNCLKALAHMDKQRRKAITKGPS